MDHLQNECLTYRQHFKLRLLLPYIIVLLVSDKCNSSLEKMMESIPEGSIEERPSIVEEADQEDSDADDEDGSSP